MKIIKHFNPIVEILDEKHKNTISNFTSSNRYPEKGLADYLKTDSFSDIKTGDGVTYIILNELEDLSRDIIAFFTLGVTAIAYTSRLKNDDGTFDEELCGIPALEVKMFAVNEIYQDTYFENRLIAALVFDYIKNLANEFSENLLGVKAIFFTFFGIGSKIL